MYIGKIPLMEQLKNYERTNSSGCNFNHSFDFSDFDRTQLRHDTLTEAIATPSFSKIAVELPCDRSLSNPEGKANELYLSLNYSENDPCGMVRNPQVNASPPTMASECHQMEIDRCAVDEQFNQNHASISEYSQMQL
ncbi:hypothetical protein TNCT_158161 [Trichonephila clavata]|uniref:Uncharacterized protein n=1 Tax=Trichonephila clavata TaxID=2740835 RepID=A0A8X6GQK1_TRICU|nr:hypothetical protein TNCT_158161 [Trichonephila clavata]